MKSPPIATLTELLIFAIAPLADGGHTPRANISPTSGDVRKRPSSKRLPVGKQRCIRIVIGPDTQHDVWHAQRNQMDGNV
jgi:hypothetical protein